MEYRVAAKEDSNAVANLHAQSWRESYRGIFEDTYLDNEVWDDRKDTWVKRLSQPKSNQYVLLALDDDMLCGFICAFGNEDDLWGTLVDNLHISRTYQGMGIGRQLMREAARWSHENFVDNGLYLEVLEGNIAACKFYEAMGGTHQETRLWSPPGSQRQINEMLYAWPSCLKIK